MSPYLLIMIIASATGGSPTTLQQHFPDNDSCLQVMQDIDNQTKENGGLIYSEKCYQIQTNN